jgi:hypothetical protein
MRPLTREETLPGWLWAAFFALGTVYAVPEYTLVHGMFGTSQTSSDRYPSMSRLGCTQVVRRVDIAQDKLNMSATHPTLQLVNALVFMLVFFLARIVYGGYNVGS